MTTIHCILTMASSCRWTLYQMDAKSTFLNDMLDEDIYVNKLEGYVVDDKEVHACKLRSCTG
eukprot:c40054_g1_i1 orf=120-305(-)